jgi:hypothetical protein
LRSTRLRLAATGGHPVVGVCAASAGGLRAYGVQTMQMLSFLASSTLLFGPPGTMLPAAELHSAGIAHINGESGAGQLLCATERGHEHRIPPAGPPG